MSHWLFVLRNINKWKVYICCCCVICICLHILVRQSNIVGSGNNPMSSAMYVGMLLRLESLSLLWSAFVLRLYTKENQNCKYQNLFRFLCWTVFFLCLRPLSCMPKFANVWIVHSWLLLRFSLTLIISGFAKRQKKKNMNHTFFIIKGNTKTKDSHWLCSF